MRPSHCIRNRGNNNTSVRARRNSKGAGAADRREFLLSSSVVVAGGALSLYAAGLPPNQTGYDDTWRGFTEHHKPKRIIGIEEHWNSKELADIGTEWREKTGSQVESTPDVMRASLAAALRKLGDFDNARFAAMDEAGISMQVLALSSPGLQGVDGAERAIALAKTTNDHQAEIIRKYPRRFAGFAALPTQDGKAAADELERSIKQLGFCGAMIHGTTNWRYLDGPEYSVLWESALALKVPIYLHVTDPSPSVRTMYDGHPELAGATWAWGVETATHALRIIGAGVFDDFPGAILILGHLGESLPYLIGRIDEGYGPGPARGRKLKKKMSDYIRENVLVTTSGLYRPEALVCAVQAMGADRVLYADDYPFVDTKLALATFDAVPLSESDREKIFHLNAERWLGLPAGAVAKRSES